MGSVWTGKTRGGGIHSFRSRWLSSDSVSMWGTTTVGWLYCSSKFDGWTTCGEDVFWGSQAISSDKSMPDKIRRFLTRSFKAIHSTHSDLLWGCSAEVWLGVDSGASIEVVSSTFAGGIAMSGNRVRLFLQVGHGAVCPPIPSVGYSTLCPQWGQVHL